MANLARQAFRRPVTPQELDRYFALSQTPQTDLTLAIQAILISPHFLFRLEPAPFDLASRLSFFLWSSIPDDDLLRAAENGTLHKPAVLEAQVRRMLQDPKSARFAETFAGQWLEIRRLESVTPDTAAFPEFDDLLRFSMRQETELFFTHILREDRSILDFIDAKYTYLNGRLGVFYGMPDVQGPGFRLVDLTGTPRAGVLGHASVLTVSSYANRTSPVLRGKWILDNFLNTPPPPPPPGVALLDQSITRTTPTCAVCHSQMDPLGFSLENFSAIGQWRTHDAGDNTPQHLTTTLRARPDAFTRCLTEKLLIYALGRGLTPADKITAQQIAARVANKQYRFSSLIIEVVMQAGRPRTVDLPVYRGERSSPAK